MMASLLGLLYLFAASHYVVREHSELYNFAMPLLESQLVPRTAHTLQRIYTALLNVIDRGLSRQEREVTGVDKTSAQHIRRPEATAPPPAYAS
jgi:hypothetical protein